MADDVLELEGMVGNALDWLRSAETLAGNLCADTHTGAGASATAGR